MAEQSRRSGGGLIGGVILLAAGGFMLFVVGRGLGRGLAEVWLYARTEGRVELFESARYDEKGDLHPASIEYTYTVGGRSLRGVYPRREGGDVGFNRVVEDRRILAGPHAPGEPISVYFDAGSPQTSTLSPAIDPQSFQILLFAATFLSFGAIATIESSGRLKRLGRWKRALGCVAAVGFLLTFLSFIPAMALPWQLAVPVLLGMLLVVLPLLSWLLLTIVNRWRRAEHRRGAAGLQWRVRRDWLIRLGATLFWCGIVGFFTVAMVVPVLQGWYAAAAFAATDGRVLSSKVDNDKPVVRYEYTVAGVKYTADRYSYLHAFWGGIPGHEKIAADYSTGQAVRVLYDPDHPAEAVLATDPPPIYPAIGALLNPFWLIGVFLIVETSTFLGRHRRAERFRRSDSTPPWPIPTWGVLRQKGDVLRLAVARRVPWQGMLAAYFGASFVGLIVAVAAASGGAADGWPVLAAALAISLGAAGLVYAFAGFRRHAVLEFNVKLRAVRLARPHEVVELPFDQIRHWATFRIAHHNENSVSYSPVLAIVATRGREIAVHLFPVGDENFEIATAAGRAFARLTGSRFIAKQDDFIDRATHSDGGLFSMFRRGGWSSTHRDLKSY